jgi:hypothetical protein
MSKENKQNLSHFEQMERIENRLAELSLIQKLLFHKYLDIAENNPAYHQKLKAIQEKIPVIKERKVFGKPIQHEEMVQRLQVEEWELNLEQKRLEHLRLRKELGATNPRNPLLSHREKLDQASEFEQAKWPLKYFLFASLLIIAMLLLFSGLSMIGQGF